MPIFQQRMASEGQCKLISDLCIQLCYTLIQRKGMIRTRFNKDIVFLDELTFEEAHKFINELLLKVDDEKQSRSKYASKDDE